MRITQLQAVWFSGRITQQSPSNITGYAEITVNNDKHRIEVGSVIPVVSKDNDCKLIFNEFAGYNVINFSLLCKKI